jgi:hypothetical protein
VKLLEIRISIEIPDELVDGQQPTLPVQTRTVRVTNRDGVRRLREEPRTVFNEVFAQHGLVSLYAAQRILTVSPNTLRNAVRSLAKQPGSPLQTWKRLYREWKDSNGA